MATEKDINFMKLALRLAKKAEGMTSPNPLVGAVLVKKGKIIGSGYHKRSGLPHAEIEAFNDARKKGHKIPGSTLYVSLEPCCHIEKKTPPCTEAIINNKISRVFVAVLDPNPKVRGSGVKRLRKANIKVETGLLKAEAAKINDVFFKYIKEKMPYTVLKLASTLDGKIATRTGDSKWIGSQKQRQITHKLRNKYDSILVGINTILKDNPSLNVRLSSGNINQPLPVILDSTLRTPADSKIFKVHNKVVIATSNRSKTKKAGVLKKNGAEIIYINSKSGDIKLKAVLKKLARMGITSVLIEGGSKVASSALKEGVVDKLMLFYSPKIVGGDGISMISGLGVADMKKSHGIKDIVVKKFGNELLVEADL